MALATIITEVVGYVTTLHPTLTSKIGGEKIAEGDVPPRLIWVPTADGYAGAKLQSVEPRPIRTRVAGAQVHVWGADLAATEILLNDTIAAIHKTAYGNFQVINGTWADQAYTNLGHVYVLEFTIEIPVTMPAWGEAEIEAVEVDAEIPDGGSDIVEFTLVP